MAFFDFLKLNSGIDPALKKELERRGQLDKIRELERAEKQASVFEQIKQLRFIRDIPVVKQSQPALRSDKPLPSTVEIKPGPRVATSEAIKRGETVITTPTPTGPRISPAGIAKEVIRRESEIAEREERFLPDLNERSKLALWGILEKKKRTGNVLSPQENQIHKDGQAALANRLFDFGTVAPIAKPLKEGVEELTERAIKTINKKVVSQRFRSDKLNLPDKITKQMEQRLKALGLETRTVRTFGEMQEAAQDLGTDVPTLLRQAKSKIVLDKEVIGLRNIINNNAQVLKKTEQTLAKNPELLDDLAPELKIAEQQIDQALKKLVQGGTEAGRAVASFRIMARNTLEPSVWLRRVQRELGDGDLTPDIRDAIFDLINKKDVNGLAEFVSMMRTPSFSEKAITLWKAGLLTSPTTHLANIGGNVTMKALLTAADVPSTGLDMLASIFTGKRTTTITPQTIKAAIAGVKKGIPQAKEFLRTGVYSSELMSKYDIPQQTGFKNKILDTYTKSVFRTLGAEDIVFRQAAMSESLEKQALIIAKNEGLRNPAKNIRVSELLKKPTNAMVKEAINAAEIATFQDKNALADFISGGKGKLAGRIKSAATRGESAAGAKITLTSAEILAPFTKTPTNIAARIADFSPVGFVKAIIKVINPKTRSQKAIVEDLGRAITGTGIIGLGALLASKDKMTGNIPKNSNERAMFYAEGKQPNSIRIGDNWYQLNRISPFGNLLALGAVFENLSIEQGLEGVELAAAGTGEAIRGLTEQTFLKGISGGLKAVTEPEASAAKFVEQTVASSVPSIIGRIARSIDPVLRDPDGILQTIQERLPILRNQLPPRRNIFGEKVGAPGGRLNVIDPFSTKKDTNDLVITEAKKIGVNIGMPPQTVSGIKMKNYEYDVYNQVNGKLTKQILETMIESESYQTLSNRDKKKLFEAVITEVRTASNSSIFPKLITERFGLPEDTDLPLLKEAISFVNSENKFKKLSDEKKEAAVKQIMGNIK